MTLFPTAEKWGKIRPVIVELSQKFEFIYYLISGLMVWSSIFLLFFLAGGTLAYSVYRYKWILNNVDMEQSDKTIFDVDFTPDYFNEVLQLQDTWLAFIVILSIILVVILLILIALRQRIQIAIK